MYERLRPLLLMGLVLISGPASAVVIDWVRIDNPGNASDTAANCYADDCGSVSYVYYISRTEITNAQYAAFLNAVDPTGANALALYNPNMGSDEDNGGISFVAGSPAGSKYLVKGMSHGVPTNFAIRPVAYISFYDALRFANWLNNGQGGASTETGAYTLLGGTPIPSNGLEVARNPGANTFLPSENEWYKAAYYSPAGGYFDYPTAINTPTVCATPAATANRANCNLVVNAVTHTGAYGGSPSPWGTFDQGGNVWEWNDELLNVGRGLRGGSFYEDGSWLDASKPNSAGASGGSPDVGLRVASLAPEPGSALLEVTSVLALAARRRRRIANRVCVRGAFAATVPLSVPRHHGIAERRRGGGMIRVISALRRILPEWSTR